MIRVDEVVNQLRNPSITWALMALCVLTMFVSAQVQTHWELKFLDTISSPVEARELIAQMSQQQRETHAWYTLTIDVFFPFVLGGFLTSAILILFNKMARLLALIPIAAIFVDLAEGAVQVLALTGTADYLAIKALLTPLKFTLFISALALVSIAVTRWLIGKLRP